MTHISSLLVRAVIFAITFMHVSNIGNYFQSLRIGYFLWHFWAVGIAVCLLLVVLSGAFFKLTKFSLPYIAWSALFLVVCLLSLFFVDNGAIAVDDFIIYCWFFGSSLALVFLVRSESDVRACGLGIVCAILVLAGLSIMEFIDPDFQVIVDRFFADTVRVGEANRSGAFYENSNDNGIAMVLGMFIGQFFLPVRLRFLFFLFVGFAVLGTVSRTAISIWAAMVIVSMLFGYGATSRPLRFVGLSLIGFAGFLLVAGEIPGLLAEAGLSDVLSPDMSRRLSGNFFEQEDGSTVARVEVAQEAWRAFVANPLSGIGLGASDFLGGEIGTHNQHLKIASELGVLGLIVYAALFLVALSSGSLIALMFLFFYAVIGFTNHGMMNYTVYGVLIPMAVLFLPELHRAETEKKRPSRRRRRKRRSASSAERELSA